jgi:iron complex outermembrane receptor protein
MLNNKYLLSALVLAMASYSYDVYAQDESADENVEEVVVTGTRLKVDGFEAVSPVTVVTSEDVDRTGVIRIEDVLNTFPQLETAETAYEPNSSGVSTLDLRGLGSSRTLPLLNGRRLQPGAVYSEVADVGQIPVSLLERVDVLTGGASAVYGADAVAGVVNFITRKVNGVEISISKSGYMHDNSDSARQALLDARGYPYPTGRSKDGEADNFEIVMGADIDGGKGNVTGYISRNTNNAVYNRDRDYSACALSLSGTSCSGSANTPIPHFDIYVRGIISDDQLAGWANPETGVNDYEAGDAYTFYERNFWSNLDTDGSVIEDDGTRYNYAAVAQLMNPTTRQSMGVIGHYDISDDMSIYAEANFSSYDLRGGIAESGTFFNNYHDIRYDNKAITDEWLASVDAYYDTFEILTVDPDDGEAINIDPAIAATFDPTATAGTEYCADEIDIVEYLDEAETIKNPTFGMIMGKTTKCATLVGYEVGIGKRNVEGGPRQDFLSSDAYRFVFGVKGNLNYRDWEYDVSYTYGNTSSSSFYKNDFSETKIVNAIEVAQEGYDVFTYNGVTPEQAASVGITGGMVGTNDLKSLNAFIAGSTQYSLPTTDENISFVAGMENRSYTYDRTPDSAYEEGLLLGFGGSVEAIKGTIKVDELYFEANVPVNDQLNADVAYRRSDYNVGGTTNTSRISVTYTATDTVKLRFGFNEAERAPQVASLYAPESQSLWTGTDPCANEGGLAPVFSVSECVNTGLQANLYGTVSASPAGQYYNYGGGNKNLTPEVAETITAGVVFELPILNGITASVDYWDISIEDAIASIDEETILELCGKKGQYCDAITRNAAGSLWKVGGFVENKLQNVAEKEWAGIDIAATTSFDVLGGTLDLRTVATNMLDKTTALIPGDATATYDCVGVISNKCYPTPEWRTRTTATFTNGSDWTFGATVRTMSGIDNEYPTDLIAQAALEDGYNLLDVFASYVVSDKVTVRGNINNLLDEAPPIIGDALSGGYANTVGGFYDSLGMYWNVSVDIKL